ncbi:MAG: hypothetical protein FWG82_00065 [Oscillospiraceae bacterium]|nr:hypothetical protein [Oscillospiraceae bacterium]
MKNWKILHPPRAFARSISKVTACFLALALVVGSFALFSGEAVALGHDAANNEIVYIRNVTSGQYITTSNNTVSANKELTMVKGTEALGQRWKVQKSGNWYVFRSAVDNNYVMSIANTSNGTTLKLIQVSTSTAFASIPSSAKFLVNSANNYGIFMMSPKLSYDASNTKFLGIALPPLNVDKIIQQPLYTPLDAQASQMWVFESNVRMISLMNYDLIDAGGHSDWDGSTKYVETFQAAINRWNNAIGSTVLRKRTGLNIKDFTVVDITTVPTTGELYYAAVTADLVYILGVLVTVKNGKLSYYTQFVDGQHYLSAVISPIQQKFIHMHELGHVLGLEHTNGRGNALSSGANMYSYSLGLDDLASYNSK